ncbi:hypothetical protein XELAEV_18000164mg [Xenopus laevis]|uniref:Uncharacterized protein n=1 Tax=Xenopus laevis TaxID=8355 RepID=A0A974BQZ0_XENLA|nr:hypothetical protein XELAEV_18000164mg [Xenopus laevis]
MLPHNKGHRAIAASPPPLPAGQMSPLSGTAGQTPKNGTAPRKTRWQKRPSAAEPHTRDSKSGNLAKGRAEHSFHAYMDIFDQKGIKIKTIPSILHYFTWFLYNVWYMSPLKRNWDILLADTDLKGFLSPFPRMTARRALSLKDKLTSSHFVNKNQGQMPTWLPKPIKGMHKCGHCKCCKYVKKFNNFTHLYNRKVYNINSFINCQTTAVIYVIECSCPLRYVGKTFRTIGKSVLEHVNDIKREVQKSAVARHFKNVHGGNTNDLKMFRIEQVSLGIRGGDTDKILLKKTSGAEPNRQAAFYSSSLRLPIEATEQLPEIAPIFRNNLFWMGDNAYEDKLNSEQRAPLQRGRPSQLPGGSGHPHGLLGPSGVNLLVVRTERGPHRRMHAVCVSTQQDDTWQARERKILPGYASRVEWGTPATAAPTLCRPAGTDRVVSARPPGYNAEMDPTAPSAVSNAQEMFQLLTPYFDNKFDLLQQTINSTLTKIESNTQRLNTVEQRVSDTEDQLNTAQIHISLQTQLIQELQEKVDDLENRSRRNNLRFLGIPESVQAADLAAYILTKLCPALQLPRALADTGIERAHRLGGERPQNRNSTRPVIARFLNYIDKELVLQAYRKIRDLQVQGQKILIFQDFSAAVSQKRREFTPICRHLFQTNVKFSLLYQAKLRVVLNGQPQLFLTPQAAREQLGLPQENGQEDNRVP